MKKSQAKIRVSNESLLVRFEKVGSKEKFQQIRNRWLKTFPQSIWNSELKGWELPSANFEDVKSFCEKMFWDVKVEPLTEFSQRPQQLNLHL